jgi:hypothetical protein
MYDPLTRPSVRHHVDKFFNTISDSTIYKIKIPTDIIYGLLEQDPIITLVIILTLLRITILKI